MSEDVINTLENSNNNNVKRNVINNVINTSQLLHRFTVRLIKTFSVPPDKIDVYHEFCKIAQREAGPRGFSQVLLNAMTEYVQRHSLPNPQVTLDRALNTGLPAKPYNVCCVPECNRKVAYRLILKNYEGKTEIFQVCRLHREWRHPEFRFIVGLKEVEG